MHLREVRLEIPPGDRGAFPLGVPSVRSLAGRPLALESPVTLFVGENGSGKSTLLEGIACAAGSVTVGAASVASDPSLAPARELARALRLSWRRRVRRGFFMRSEDFFGYVRGQRQMREELERDLAAVDEDLADHSDHARALARMPHAGQLADMRRRYGGDLDGRSHGESFLSLFRERFVPGGLYLLDEPEAPLSPTRQIALLVMLRDMAAGQDAQFIVATHSPILMALPGATIYSFDGGEVRQVAFADTEHVSVTRAFLADPQRFLSKL